MSLRDRLLEDDLVAEQTMTGVPTEGWPVQFLFYEEAYEQYKAYAKVHAATKADPLRTFSGWLHQQGIQIVDEE